MIQTQSETHTKTRIELRNILVATDFSPASEIPFHYAKDLADHYGAELYIAHVISANDRFGVVPSDPDNASVKQAQRTAREQIGRLLPATNREHYHPVVAEGKVAEVLIEIIRRDHIDLAVVGTHGRGGLKRMVLGSVAEELFRMAPCPILTAGPKSAPRPSDGTLHHVLYPLEFVPDPSPAADYAISLAERYGANLTLMNVWEDTDPSAAQAEQINERATHWLNDHIPEPLPLRGHTRFERGFGPAAQAIVEFASRAGVDIIV